ncbi:MAG TPA: hypothetical protein VN663_14345 [Ramlibacter sp.]|nr:hypothetical protein [Ramlibacter sp.]
MTAFVGFAEFDVLAQPSRAYVGWAEFDALSTPSGAYVGWAEFDTQAFVPEPPPVQGRGGGGDRGRTFPRFGKRYDSVKKQYNVYIENVDEAEEEDILMKILMEIASHEL